MTFMPDQEAPSMRKIADYLEDTESSSGDVHTEVGDNREDAEIAALACQLWEDRGRLHGSDQEDWFKAERQLKANGRRLPGVAVS